MVIPKVQVLAPIILTFIMLSALTLGLVWEVVPKEKDIPYPKIASFTAKPSIVLFIGDGMAPNQIEFGRLVEYGSSGNSSILQLPYHTFISTDNVDDTITDSAAAATAIATGYKTHNSYVGMDASGNAVPTILEKAEAQGYVTGIIVTCQMNHATPAAFAAHNIDRTHYNAIAVDMGDSCIDLLLGGGSDNNWFGSQISPLRAKGYTYITTSAEWGGVTSLPTLGLFNESALPYEKDRIESIIAPSLTDMVERGIALLNASGKPFMLIVEGSQIDWGGHNNDKVILAHEVIEFEKAVKYVLTLVEPNDNLQVLICGDHETGGFSIVSDNFVTPIPAEEDPLPVKIEKRTNRSNEMTVAFTTTGHTHTQVYLAGIGPYTDQITKVTHHVDTFQIMRQAVEGTLKITNPNPEGLEFWWWLGLCVVGVATIFRCWGGRRMKYRREKES